MFKNKKMGLLVVLYLLVVIVLGRLIFTIPNSKYLSILNADNFYTVCCVATILCILFIFMYLKISKIKKMIFTFIATFIIFSVVGIYYYLNLPEYTYDEAVAKVERYETQLGKSVEVHNPPYREDKLGIGKKAFFKTTNYSYYIYLTVEDQPVVYKFNPLNGVFEENDRVREF